MILVFDVRNVFHFSIRKSSIFSEFDIYIIYSFSGLIKTARTGKPLVTP